MEKMIWNTVHIRHGRLVLLTKVILNFQVKIMDHHGNLHSSNASHYGDVRAGLNTAVNLGKSI